MKKLTKIISTVMAGIMFLSALPVATASAASVTAPKKVTVSNTKKGVKITWKKSKGADKYTVMRKAKGEKSFSKVKTVKKTKTSFVDKTAKAGKKYTYAVKAVDGTKTATSKEATVVRLKTPNVKNCTDDYSVALEWKEVKGAKYYLVYRAKVVDGKTGEFKKVSKAFGNYYFGEDEKRGTYKYKVVAVKGKYQSAVSKVVKVNYDPAPAYTVAVGETNEDLKSTIEFIEALYAAMGLDDMTLEFKFVSADESILTIDENYTMTGISPGLVEVTFTVTATYQGETVSELSTFEVEVIPATETTPEPTEPTEPAEPIDPTEPAEPVEPVPEATEFCS